MHASVGAALCCEEAGDSSEDLRCYHRPLRSTRLRLHGLNGLTQVWLISRSLVSGMKKIPSTAVISAITIGYHKP